MKKVHLSLFLSGFLCAAPLLYGQKHAPAIGPPLESVATDSNQTTIVRAPESVITDGDTLAGSGIEPVSVGIDSPVVYSARMFDSDEQNHVIYLIRDATIRYKNFEIKAGKITVFWDENKILAETLADTLHGGSSGHPDSMTIRQIGQPFFTDGRERLKGDRMEFNFKSEKGRIIRGRTDFQGGYYQGGTVKRVDPKVFYVRNGIYSTCDLDEPHFHFAGKKMKIILEDKVVAKPIVLKMGKIPVAIFPFAMFELNERGRQSGLILPDFGSSETEGRYLLDLGYYWATNDYFDVAATIDFFERTGFRLNTRANYALRYYFRGSVSASFARKDFDTGFSQRLWEVRVQHSQTFDANTSLAVSGNFLNDNSFYKDFSTDRDDRLRRQLISNATFSKRWGEGKNSLTLNLSQTKDLQNGRESLTLPRMQFARTRGPLFAPGEEPGRGGAPAESRWYNNFLFDYRGLFQNTAERDSSQNPLDFEWGANHDLTFSYTSPNRIFGWLSLTQSLTVDEDWFDRTSEFILGDSTITPKEKEGFAARHLFRYSAGTSTNMYGTFFPNIGPVKAIRHKLSPAVSFSFQPDYTRDFWGYFVAVKDAMGNEVVDEDGNVIKRDRFGGTPTSEQNSINFSLNNLFQMKLGEGESEKKVDLFNMNFGSGYNFAADSLKMQNLRTSFFANPRRNINVTLGMNHSFYKFDEALGTTVNEFISPRLTQMNFDLRWSIGRGMAGITAPAQSENLPGSEPLLGEEELLEQVPSDSGKVQPLDTAWSLSKVPWGATIGFTYGISKFNPSITSRSVYLNISNVSIRLTKNWRIGYRMRWDIEEGSVVEQSISFHRDLHCWEAQFNWNPTGITEGFYFRIGIKAPHLQALKFEQRGGTSTIFRGF